MQFRPSLHLGRASPLPLDVGYLLKVAPAPCSHRSSTTQPLLQHLLPCWGFFALGYGVSPQSLPSAGQPWLQCLPSCWGFSALGCEANTLLSHYIVILLLLFIFMVATFKIQSFSNFEVYVVLSIQFSVVLMLCLYQIIRDCTFRSFNDR